MCVGASGFLTPRNFSLSRARLLGRAVLKAGLLTSFRLPNPFPPFVFVGSGYAFGALKGTYSCGTVGDFHPCSLFIAVERTFVGANVMIIRQKTMRLTVFSNVFKINLKVTHLFVRFIDAINFEHLLI